MTAPQDPRKTPLQDDEIALARVLRALPAAEPPARLDAAILAAATDAVSPTPRRRVRPIAWLPTWAVGTAAAAVLAVGVGMQLRPPLATGPLPQSESAEKATRLPDARLDVELYEPPPAPIPAPPPPPAQTEPVPQSSARRAAPPPPPPAPVVAEAPAAPVAEAFPMEQAEAAGPATAAAEAESDAATLDTVQVTGSRLRSEGSDQARRAHQEAYATRARERQQAEAARQREELGRLQARREARERDGFLADPVGIAAPEAKAAQDSAASAGAAAVAAAPATAPAPAPAATAPAAPPADMQARDLAGNETTAQAPGYGAPLPPVARDAELAPADWLARIRLRLARGDRDDARESLRLYQRAHPEAPVPDDLATLR